MSIRITADYKKAFKDADIRGVYPQELDEEVAYLVARAFIDEYKFSKIALGRDMRLSSPALHEAFLKGAVDAGASVIDIGLVSTPMVYYAAGAWQVPGVMITASHSPRDYNGLKIVLPGAIPLTEAHGLAQIRKRMEKGNFKLAKRPGVVKRKDISKLYQRAITTIVPQKIFKDQNLSLLVDCGNGMSSLVWPLLAEKLPIKFSALASNLDGSFPSRGSDPTLKRNQRAIVNGLKAGTYDFGVSFDGDADRIAFFDEKGRYINSAVIGAIIARRLLNSSPGARVVYTNLTSRIFEETVRASGGKPIIARVGHAFIKEMMRKKDAVFGAEHSGHFYFKDYFFTDSVEYTLMHVLATYVEAKSAGQTFSDFVKPYQHYQQTEDVIVAVEDQPAALELVRQWLEKHHPRAMKRFDGYSVDFGEVWGSVKISVTEPALKMMFEGRKKKPAQRIQDDLKKYIAQIAQR